MHKGISIAAEISGPFVILPRVARHGPMLKLQWAWFGVYLINYGFIRMLNDLTAKGPKDWESHTRFLWDLLDNIDTLDDACKDDDLAFRNLARTQQHRRYEISDSDGFVVTFKEGKPDEG
jgi:hypothetical protein